MNFELYFKDIEKTINLKCISSRVKFMLQDLVDLRRNHWKPRRDVAGPKTIDQISSKINFLNCFLNNFFVSDSQRGRA